MRSWPPGSIDEMRAKLPSAEYRLFEGSGHSIHNDLVHATAFRDGLCALVDAAAVRGASKSGGKKGDRICWQNAKCQEIVSL